MLVVLTGYLDRTALAFAALQLCDEEWFDARVYGLGSGLFYGKWQVIMSLSLHSLHAYRGCQRITLCC